jgi:hypothetical protein
MNEITRILMPTSERPIPECLTKVSDRTYRLQLSWLDLQATIHATGRVEDDIDSEQESYASIYEWLGSFDGWLYSRPGTMDADHEMQLYEVAAYLLYQQNQLAEAEST